MDDLTPDINQLLTKDWRAGLLFSSSENAMHSSEDDMGYDGDRQAPVVLLPRECHGSAESSLSENLLPFYQRGKLFDIAEQGKYPLSKNAY